MTNTVDNEQRVAQLVKQLRSWKRATRKQAEQDLRAMGAEAVGPLTKILAVSESGCLMSYCGAEWYWFLLLGIIYCILSRFVEFHYYGWKRYVAYFPMYGILGLVSSHLPRWQDAAKRILFDFDDVSIVGALIDARTPKHYVHQFDASSPNSADFASMADKLLCSLLPRFTSEQRYLLTDDQYEKLFDVLKDGNSELVLAALAALNVIGGPEALPKVKMLSNRANRLIYPAAKDRHVRQVALDCMAAIGTRIGKGGATQVLLRPSAAPASDTLLRPAHGAGDTPPELLLRASEVDASRKA